jgi:hypothetical protein
MQNIENKNLISLVMKNVTTCLINIMNMVNSILLLVMITVKNLAHPDSISLWIFRNEEMRCSRLYFNGTKKIRLYDTKGPMKERLLQKGGKNVF